MKASETNSYLFHEPQRKHLRSSIEDCDLKSQCFFCGKKSPTDKKNAERNLIHIVTFVEFYKNIFEKCSRRNGTWGDKVYVRLSCSNDLVADEGRYHKTCLQRFMTDKKSPDLEDEENRERSHPTDEGMLHWFEMLCIWLDIDSDVEPYTLKELHSKMYELAGDDNVYCLKRLKQKLQERCENKLYFAKIEGKSDVLCFQNMIDYYLNDL